MIKKLLAGGTKSLTRKLYSETKKDSSSIRVDSKIWAQMQASALVGNDEKSCARCRR
jgi:hypothetical protein